MKKIENITELHAIAQSGLAYCKDKFDIERYQRLLEISADLLSANSELNYEDIFELFKKDTGYITPKTDVRGAVFKESKILLVQENSNDLWSLPGGWADVNLSPSENIIKEIREETGFYCSVTKLIGIFDKRKSNAESIKWPHIYKLFFLCEIDIAEQVAFDSNEILSIDFFDRQNIPPLSLARVTYQQIDLCFKHFENKFLPSEFD
jgi:ADP-ribose pyrophosphatase YjhB (NUDIX family)